MADKKRRRGIDPLMESVLRQDPAAAAKLASGRRTADWLGKLEAERTAKMGESTGLGDILTLLPGAQAAKALAARELLPAGVNALAFTSQFSDDPVSRAAGDVLSVMPNLRGLSKLAKSKRAAELYNRLGQDFAIGSLAGGAAGLAGLTSSTNREGESLATVPSWKKLARSAAMQTAKEKGVTGPRTAYHDFLDKMDKLTPKKYPVQEFQKTLGETGTIPVVRAGRTGKQSSQRRLGEFYNVGTPTTLSPQNQWLRQLSGSSTGGDIATTGFFAPRNPYLRDDREGTPNKTIEKLLGKKRATELQGIASKFILSEDDVKDLGKVGINKKDILNVWSSKEGGWAREDAINAKVLSNAGFDLLVETRPSTARSRKGLLGGEQMYAPEVFKFREPRYNFSFDRRSPFARGLNEPRISKTLGNPAGVSLSDEDIRNFAAGRSPEFGLTGTRKATAQPGWGSPIIPGISAKKLASPSPGGGSSLGPPAWDPIAYQKSQIAKGEVHPKSPTVLGVGKVTIPGSEFHLPPTGIPGNAPISGKELDDLVAAVRAAEDYTHPVPGVQKLSGGKAVANPYSMDPQHSELFAKLFEEGLISKSGGAKFRLGGKSPELVKRLEATGLSPVKTRLEEQISNLFTLGGAAAGAGTLAEMATGGEESGDRRAGLVPSPRNAVALQRLVRDQQARLAKIRPEHPELNQLEALFAAKYPKIYEKSTAGIGGTFAQEPGRTGGGSYDPTSGGVFLHVPKGGSPDWKNLAHLTPESLNSMGHEALHATDFQRLGRINDPATGKRIELGDFLSPGIVKQSGAKKRLERRIADLGYEDLPMTHGPSYLTSQAAVEKVKDPQLGRILYETQPIERRAFKAGATSEKSTRKLIELLKRDPKRLTAPTEWESDLEEILRRR